MKKRKTSVSVILPTYNEAENIVPLIREILSALRDFKTDILVVDDNSPDGTGDIADTLAKDRPVVVVHRFQEKGYGNSIIAIMAGLLANNAASSTDMLPMFKDNSILFVGGFLNPFNIGLVTLGRELRTRVE